MKGQVAIITGGASGIGASFTEHLLKSGVKVAICDVNRSLIGGKVKELSEKYGKENVLGLTCDVTNTVEFEDTFKKTIKHFGKLDIVINNAGICNEKESQWEKVVDINFTAVVKGTLLATKYMGKLEGGKGGTVINIASVTSLRAFPTIPVYSATKAAVNQYSRSQGGKFLYDITGVRVVSINPGFTVTPLTQGAETLVIYPEEFTRFCGEHFKYQSVDNMGRGLIQVLESAESGDVWTIENDLPAHKTIIS